MNPRIVVEEYKLYTDARGLHTDHHEAWYLDATGKRLYRGEHQDNWALAYAELHTKLRQEGISTKDVPIHWTARYLGEH